MRFRRTNSSPCECRSAARRLLTHPSRHLPASQVVSVRHGGPLNDVRPRTESTIYEVFPNHSEPGVAKVRIFPEKNAGGRGRPAARPEVGDSSPATESTDRRAMRRYFIIRGRMSSQEIPPFATRGAGAGGPGIGSLNRGRSRRCGPPNRSQEPTRVAVTHPAWQAARQRYARGSA
jgi:hypothetical protein